MSKTKVPHLGTREGGSAKRTQTPHSGTGQKMVPTGEPPFPVPKWGICVPNRLLFSLVQELALGFGQIYATQIKVNSLCSEKLGTTQMPQHVCFGAARDHCHT